MDGKKGILILTAAVFLVIVGAAVIAVVINSLNPYKVAYAALSLVVVAVVAIFGISGFSRFKPPVLKQ